MGGPGDLGWGRGRVGAGDDTEVAQKEMGVGRGSQFPHRGKRIRRNREDRRRTRGRNGEMEN